MPKATGAAGMDLRAVTKENRPESEVPTLADLGIDKRTSSRAQKLAALSEKTFAAVASGDMPAPNKLLRAKDVDGLGVQVGYRPGKFDAETKKSYKPKHVTL
jgi:hypothetical protein